MSPAELIAKVRDLYVKGGEAWQCADELERALKCLEVAEGTLKDFTRERCYECDSQEESLAALSEISRLRATAPSSGGGS